MTQLRSVNTHFWKDSFIVDCTQTEKLIFLYLLTNEASNLAGCYEISVKRIAFDVDVSKKTVISALNKFESAGKIIFRDGWLLLNRFHKHQHLNKNMGVSAGRIIVTAPEWAQEAIKESLNRNGGIPEWFPNGNETIKGKGKEREEEKECDPDDENIFSIWIRIAKMQGTSEKSARSQLGQLISEFGEETVTKILLDKKEILPDKAHAFSYLKKCVSTESGIGKHVNPHTGRGLGEFGR